MATQNLSSRYSDNDFVEVLVDNQWTLGIVTQVENRGYYEYNITLLTDGSVVTEVARNMRKSEVIIENLTVDESFEVPNPPIEPVAGTSTDPDPVPGAKVKSNRFAKLLEAEVAAIETSAKAKKTIEQTRWGVKIFRDWLKDVEEDVEFEQLSAESLAPLLRRFYAEVRQKNGAEYQKKSLLCIRAAVHRHLTTTPHSVSFNIMSDPIFTQANSTLVGHIKLNKRAGLDNSSSYQAISDADEKKMYSSHTLSDEDPTSLQFKVYYEMALHFGRRAREGLHSLKKEHFVFKKDDNNKEYATLTFHSLEKNHQGLSDKEGEHEQRMYATDQENCPVKSLKLYLSKLHPDHSSFFQTPKKKHFKLSTTWYQKSAVGVNTIGKFMATISVKARLSRTYTNHCVRATCVTKLREQGVAAKDIKSVTGHRSESSIDFYSKTPDDVREDMSKKLAGVSTKDDISFSQTNVMNVQAAHNAGSMFSNVTFQNCTVNVNISK